MSASYVARVTYLVVCLLHLLRLIIGGYHEVGLKLGSILLLENLFYAAVASLRDESPSGCGSPVARTVFGIRQHCIVT
jgi:hypothetical protein